MHQATLRAESEYNNIRAIASKVNGFGGQAFSAQANASQAEKTICWSNAPMAFILIITLVFDPKRRYY
jgi:hypothetical protein